MINKDKNVIIQITLPKTTAMHLETLVKAFNDEGIHVTKSQVVNKALSEYIKMIVYAGQSAPAKKQKQEQDKEEN